MDKNRAFKNPAAANRRRIVVPKNFPEDGPARSPHSGTRKSLRSRISGPMGSFALHATLLLLLFHSNALREVFGASSATDEEWSTLPEITILSAPHTPTPEPTQEIVRAPEPEPATESPPPPDPAPPEPLPAPPEEPPLPTPPTHPPPDEIAASIPTPPAAEPAASVDPDAWTPVREIIAKSVRYPSHARRSGITGLVTLLLEMDESGRIVSATLRPPSPSDSLCEAALKAVRRIRPFPELGEAIRQGRAPRRAEIAIRFELDEPRP